MEVTVFHIIKMNLIAGIFVLLVTVVSKCLGRRYSARWKYWCWLILAVFLLIPVDFSRNLSVVQVGIPAASSEVMDLSATGREGVSQSIQSSDGNSKTSIGELPGSTEKAVSQKDLQEFEPYHFQNGKNIQGSDVTVSTEGNLISSEVLLFVWISGVCIISLYQIVKYQIASRQMMRWSYPAKGEKVIEVLERQSRRMEIRKKPRVMMNGQISSPMIAGFLRPCLFIPEQPYTYGQLELICRHELVHYRQKDIWYKSLLIFVRTIYWFNPALYLMFREAGKDLEFVCDENVMKNAGKETRLTYNQLLITAVEKKGRTRILFSTGFNGGIGVFKKRMANIMYMKRRRKGICVGALCCTFLVGSAVLIGCFVVESQSQVTAAAVDSVPLKEVNQGTEVLVDPVEAETDAVSSVKKNGESLSQSGWIGEAYYDEQGNLVTDNSPYEYEIINQGQYLLYYNRIYGFSFQVPVEWETEMTTSQYVKEGFRSLSFSDSANRSGDQYGEVFSIVVSDLDQEEEQIWSEGEYLYHFQFNGEDKALYKIGPTDMQVAPPYTQQLLDSYNEKIDQMTGVLGTVGFDTMGLSQSNHVSGIQPASAYVRKSTLSTTESTEDSATESTTDATKVPDQGEFIDLQYYLYQNSEELAVALGLSGVEEGNGRIWEGEQAYLKTSPEGTGYIEAAIIYPNSRLSFYGLHTGMNKEQAEDNLSRSGWRWNNTDNRNTEYISGEMDSLVLSWGEDGTVQEIAWKAGS